jgi:hypothetical protein
MQPIVRPAARYAGPEQDMKLLNRDHWKFERPADYSPAFSFADKFKFPYGEKKNNSQRIVAHGKMKI